MIERYGSKSGSFIILVFYGHWKSHWYWLLKKSIILGVKLIYFFDKSQIFLVFFFIILSLIAVKYGFIA